MNMANTSIKFNEVKEVINPFASSPEGAKKKYDVSSNFYHLIMGVWEIRPNNDAIELADIKEGEVILDAAFGTGWCLKRMIEKVGDVVHGIDFSRGMCMVCRKNLEKENMEHLANIIQADVLSIPFKEKVFDVVFSSFLLDLLPTNQIQKALLEMKRVLKEDGRIVAVSLTKDGDGMKKVARYFYEWFYDRWPVIGGYRASSRPIYLEKEIEKAGFFITKRKLTCIPIFQFPVKIVVAKSN